ncbi:MAG TPA: hypothetical protein VKA01_12045 [Vicinamibacteria bacterium]|nr:hypothetical protein [Vicinamibacteria bacterium]
MRIALALLLAASPALGAEDTAAKPFAVEYYYKARWGHYDEFVKLFRKNHWPLLKRQKEQGRILEVRADVPRYHGTEDGRWDYRVTIVWRDLATAYEKWPDQERVTAELFADRKAFEAEEQRRFEILLAHWDLPVTSAELGN